MSDFNNKINFLLKRKITEISGRDNFCCAYNEIYEIILNMLIKLDYDKYNYSFI